MARVTVVRSDARRFLARSRGAAFDLVLCDPPYRLADRLASELDPLIRRVLADGGGVVMRVVRDNPARKWSSRCSSSGAMATP